MVTEALGSVLDDGVELVPRQDPDLDDLVVEVECLG
jgi:hypothetical protein